MKNLECLLVFLSIHLFSAQVVKTMPMQNAALWILLLGRPHKFELYIMSTYPRPRMIP